MFESILPFALFIALMLIVAKGFGSFDATYSGINIDSILLREVAWRVCGIVCGALALNSSVKDCRKVAFLLIVLAAAQLPFFIKEIWFRTRFHCYEQEGLLSTAKTDSAQGRYEDAERIYRAILVKQAAGYFKQDDLIRWQLGEILVRQEKYEEGIDLYQSVIENEKTSQATLYVLAQHCQNLAHALKRANRLSESVASYKETLDLNRRNNQLNSYFTIVCRKQLASVLYILGKTSEARAQEVEAEAVLQKHHWEYTSCPEDD